MPEDIPKWQEEEQYELVPFKEINELKDELRKLRDVPIPSSKKMQVSMDEIAMKMDRLIQIFEQAYHEMRAEEGGLSFAERMKPLVDKMDKILEQHSELAKGIVALADMMEQTKSVQSAPSSNMFAPQPLPGMMPPPPPPKKGLF